MEIAIKILLILHFIGLAAIIGSWIATMKTPRITTGFLHGAILQLVTGVILVGLREMEDLVEVNHVKITIKLLVTVAVLVLAIIGLRKEKASSGTTATLAHIAGALAVANVAIAVLV